MKIFRELVPVTTLEAFADQHGLTMEVTERRTPLDASNRFFACFANAWVVKDGCQHGVFGNGATEEQAIANYASLISLELLAVDGVEILVPRLEA